MQGEDLEELELLQKNNAKICSNATALLDESEEELCKIDSWLVRSPQSSFCQLSPHTHTPCRDMCSNIRIQLIPLAV
jgi:hypothetical protein